MSVTNSTISGCYTAGAEVHDWHYSYSKPTHLLHTGSQIPDNGYGLRAELGDSRLDVQQNTFSQDSAAIAIQTGHTLDLPIPPIQDSVVMGNTQNGLVFEDTITETSTWGPAPGLA